MRNNTHKNLCRVLVTLHHLGLFKFPFSNLSGIGNIELWKRIEYVSSVFEVDESVFEGREHYTLTHGLTDE